VFDGVGVWQPPRIVQVGDADGVSLGVLVGVSLGVEVALGVEVSLGVEVLDGFCVLEGEGGGGTYGAWPVSGAVPSTLAGGGNCSMGSPCMSRCMTCVQVSAG
jgi:hypothetical protein